MKKIFLNVATLYSISLFIISCLSISCNQNQGENSSKKDSLTTVSDKGTVFVNTDSLLANYEYVKDIEKDSKDEVGKVQSDLEARGRSFENAVVDFQKRGRDMSLVQQEQTQQKLAQEKQYLERLSGEAQQRLMEKQQKNNVDINKRLRDYFKKYSKEKGYQYVLGFSEGNPGVWFAESSADVTDDVLKGLNAAYRAEKDSSKVKK